MPLDTREGRLWEFAFRTGMRQGEVLALWREQVDLENATVSVTHTFGKDTQQRGPTKTGKSNIIYLSTPEVALLKRIRDERFAEGLCHSNATFWAEHEPIALVSARPGHSKVSTTADIYTHVRQNAQAEAAERVSQRMRMKVAQ